MLCAYVCMYSRCRCTNGPLRSGLGSSLLSAPTTQRQTCKISGAILLLKKYLSFSSFCAICRSHAFVIFVQSAMMVKLIVMHLCNVMIKLERDNDMLLFLAEVMFDCYVAHPLGDKWGRLWWFHLLKLKTPPLRFLIIADCLSLAIRSAPACHTKPSMPVFRARLKSNLFRCSLS